MTKSSLQITNTGYDYGYNGNSEYIFSYDLRTGWLKSLNSRVWNASHELINFSLNRIYVGLLPFAITLNLTDMFLLTFLVIPILILYRKNKGKGM